MKIFRLALTTLILTLLCSIIPSATAATITRIYTSPTPPVSMPAGLGGTGIAYKAVEEVLKRANIEIPITFGDWDIVYEKALNDKGAAVFPAVMTADRRNNFYWVGPIASLDYFVYKPRGSNIQVNGMDDIRNAQKIATVKDFAVNETLRNAGCTNLVYYDTAEQALNALLNGAASIGIFPDTSVKGFLKNMGVKGTKRLIPIHMFMKRNLYYALNKQTNPRVAMYMQQILLDMKRDGTLDALYKRYLPDGRQPKIPDLPVFPGEMILPAQTSFAEPLIINGKAVPVIKTNIVERRSINSEIMTKEGQVVSDNAPRIMTIYAEEFPPFTFTVGNSNYVQGAAAELVAAIQNEMGLTPSTIQLTEWNSAFFLAKTTPNAALCTLKRTPERENDFYWIGPYAADSAWIYVRRDSPFNVNNINEAKTIPAIACVGGAFAGETLSNLGFSNLIPFSTPNEAMTDMMNDPMHAAAFSSATAPYVARAAGFSAINMRPLIQIAPKTNYYIGISKSTPKDIAIAAQNAFASLQRQGKVKMILDRWFK